VIVFYNMLPNGMLDEYSLHGGCKVEEGEKWCVSRRADQASGKAAGELCVCVCRRERERCRRERGLS